MELRKYKDRVFWWDAEELIKELTNESVKDVKSFLFKM